MNVRNPLLSALFDTLKNHPVISDEMLLEIKKIINILPNADLLNQQEVALYTELNASLQEIKIALPKKVNIDSMNDDGYTLLMLAARKNHAKVIAELLKAKADPNIQGGEIKETALTWAAFNNNTEIAHMLIEAKADPNLCEIRGSTALSYAARAGNNEIIHALLNAKAHINPQVDAHPVALIEAVYCNHKDSVAILLESKADPNICLGSSLIKAASSGSKEIVNQLLAANADPNVKSSKGSALMQAVLNNHHEIVHCLLVAKANTELQDNIGNTALHLACRSEEDNADDIAYALLKAKANVNIENYSHETPLIITVKNSMMHKLVPILLEAKADPNIVGSDIGTALHCAVWYDYIKVLNILLTNKDIQLETMNNAGFTPLDMALRTSKPSFEIPHCLGILINHGAKIQQPGLLYHFLRRYDQNWPEIMEAFSGLYKQLHHRITSGEDVPKVELEIYEHTKRYLKKLMKLNNIYKNKVINAIDLATEKKIPMELLKLINDYDVPLGYPRVQFFKPDMIDALLPKPVLLERISGLFRGK